MTSQYLDPESSVFFQIAYILTIQIDDQGFISANELCVFMVLLLLLLFLLFLL